MFKNNVFDAARQGRKLQKGIPREVICNLYGYESVCAVGPSDRSRRVTPGNAQVSGVCFCQRLYDKL